MIRHAAHPPINVTRACSCRNILSSTITLQGIDWPDLTISFTPFYKNNPSQPPAAHPVDLCQQSAT